MQERAAKRQKSFANNWKNMSRNVMEMDQVTGCPLAPTKKALPRSVAWRSASRRGGSGVLTHARGRYVKMRMNTCIQLCVDMCMQPLSFVILGATGDLARKKLYPAVAALQQSKL